MLNVEGLTFAYGAIEVLRDVSMSMAPGRVTCVMGRNGVGKTTLMKNIMGLLKPSRGRVKLGERDISLMRAAKRARTGIALVPQGRMIFPKLTVEQNLRIGLQANPKRTRTIPGEVFELFPVLKEMSHRMGGDLSGGQQQQLAIARAMVGDPKVMLLDEPTEGIQPNVIQQIGKVLHQLVEEKGMTVVLVEQYVDFVKEFGHHYYIMNRGRVVDKGEPSDLTQDHVHQHLGV